MGLICLWAGVGVRSVSGPAMLAGIRTDSAIIAVNGISVTSKRQVDLLLGVLAPGDSIIVGYQANILSSAAATTGSYAVPSKTVAVQLAAVDMPLESVNELTQLKASMIKMNSAFAFVLASCVGLKVISGGLFVAVVSPGSPAANAGLQKGDILARANGKPLRSYSCFLEQIEASCAASDDTKAGVSASPSRGWLKLEVLSQNRPHVVWVFLLGASVQRSSNLQSPASISAPPDSPVRSLASSESQEKILGSDYCSVCALVAATRQACAWCNLGVCRTCANTLPRCLGFFTCLGCHQLLLHDLQAHCPTAPAAAPPQAKDGKFCEREKSGGSTKSNIKPRNEEEEDAFLSSSLQLQDDLAGDTQLLVAVRTANTSLLAVLLQAPHCHHFINLRGALGNTALHEAVLRNAVNTATALLDAKADPNLFNDARDRPLGLCAKHGFFPLANKLLDAKADPNALNGHGNTALHIAVSNSRLDMLQLLLHSRAGVEISNLDGLTAMGIAVRLTERNSPTIVSLLMQAGASKVIFAFRFLFCFILCFSDRAISTNGGV
jgi:hypothetical protein